MEEGLVQKLGNKPQENVSLLWDDHPLLILLIGGLVFVILVMAFAALGLLLMGLPNPASTFADIGSAFATIMLAALTGIYVVATKRLVQESQRSREHQEEMYSEEKNDEREHVRKALRTELGQIDYVEDLVEHWETEGYIPTEKKIPKESIPPAEHIPTRVFEAHIDDLGVLENEEATNILEYYQTIIYIKELIAEIRNGNTDTMNAHEALFGLMKKYETMRPQLIEMLDDKRKPEEVETETVLRTLDGTIKKKDGN